MICAEQTPLSNFHPIFHHFLQCRSPPPSLQFQAQLAYHCLSGHNYTLSPFSQINYITMRFSLPLALLTLAGASFAEAATVKKVVKVRQLLLRVKQPKLTSCWWNRSLPKQTCRAYVNPGRRNARTLLLLFY